MKNLENKSIPLKLSLRLKVVLAIILIGLLCALLTANPVQAARFQLMTQGGEPLYQTTLDLAIYQQGHRDHVQDLILSNGRGESLPYVLLPYATMHPQKHPQTAQTLDVYPVFQADLKQAGILKLPFDKIVDAAVADNHKPLRKSADLIYLVDAGELHAPLQTLKATWQDSQNQLVAIEIFSSNDLSNWLKIGDAALLSADHHGQEPLRDTIILNALTSARYLLIKPHNVLPDDAFKLTGIQAIYHSKISTNLPILWQTATLINHEEDQKNALISFNFKAPSHFAANYLRIKLPLQDTISNVSMRARKTPHSPWVQVAQAPIYRIIKNGSFMMVNPDIRINPTSARYWQLTFSQHQATSSTQTPALQLGCLPDTLIWSARGTPPFTLKVSEKSATTNASHSPYSMPDYTGVTLQNLPKAALQYDPHQPEHPIWQMRLHPQTWWFWAGLVIGVLILAGLLYKLVQSNQRSHQK